MSSSLSWNPQPSRRPQQQQQQQHQQQQQQQQQHHGIMMSPDQQRGILRRTPPTGGSNAGYSYSSGNGNSNSNSNNHMSASRQRGALVLDAAAAPSLGASSSQCSSVSIVSTESYESTPFQQQQDNLFSRIKRRGYGLSMHSSSSSNNNLRDLPQSLSSTASDACTPAGRYTPSPSTRRRDAATMSSSTPNSNNMHHNDNGANYSFSPHPNSNSNHTNMNVGVMEDTAAVIARQAPAAGYLLKMGTNVPNYKRRFFVLQQTTSLYYFLSPNDTNPRGCLDIEGSTLEEVGELSDGRFRFAVCWHDSDNDTVHNAGSGGSRPKILLEARSRKVGEEWMQSLRQERMSYVKGELTKAQRKNSAYTSRITELERQVADFKLVEKDRDGALEDAARWKDQFEQLDESLRCLTQQLRRQPVEESSDSLLSTPTRKGSSETNQVEKEKDEKEKGNDAVGDLDETAATAEKESDESESQGIETNTSREISLLDEAVMEEEKAIDVMNVPGIYYSALHNACEQLRENLRLASDEASTAVEDLSAANERVISVEKRMEKAEKHLGKLWEENCTVRKSLKQKKREKRVLVREVKTLLEEAKLQKRDEISMHDMPADDSSSRVDGSDEEKMINELEEHVMSSIRLHEELLVANGIARPQTRRNFTELNDAGSSIGGTGPTRRIGFSAQSHTGSSSAANPREAPKDDPPLVSLFDDSESEDDDDGDDVVSTSPSLVSSVVAEASDCETNGIVDAGVVLQSKARPDSSPDSSPERPNPMLQLDEDDDGSEQPNLCAESSQSESSKSVFANMDQATSRLVCPLADVIQTKHSAFDEERQVYHLAFYSRKIGLQFQKVPPPPVRPKGLLTDAMTADLAEVPSGSERTAAELRRIAAISTRAKSEDNEKGTTCKVATPVDAVLVCGFHGFDDSGTNVRPNLGARLIAFDGVSVEVGHWTFDSIRKSIQSRARPLTLSFRNDFLTTEQRTILTKAVKEVDLVVPPPRRALQYQTSEDRPSSTDPSMQSYEAGHFINESDSRGAARATDEESNVSGASSDNYNYRGLPQSFSGAKSFSSLKSNGNFRSFSEAGSSASSVLSAVAPLMANLLHRRSSDPFTPEYLRRAPESVEDTPQHQDFKAELL